MTGSASNGAEPAAAAFDRIATDALARARTPGFSLAIVRAGSIVYAQGFGFREVERKTPIEPSTPFAIGSITKQFTAASILLLAQRGQVRLDDRLATYLPTFPNATAITLRMLLNQTSGLHNYPVLGEHDWPTSGPSRVEDLMAFLAADKPDFAPGTKWAYSNANYTLLAAVVEKAGGRPMGDFLQQNLFEPLGMTMSGYGFAAQQRLQPAPPDGISTTTAASALSLDLYSGAGAMISNAPDVARWDIALLAGHVLDPDSLRALWEPGTLTTGAPVNYAMGFVPTTFAGHREVWHNGLAPGVGGYCYNAIFPDDALAVVVLSNGSDFATDAQTIVERVVAAYDPTVTAQLPALAAPPAAPGEDAAVTARAKDWFRRLQTGTVDLSQVEPHFAQVLTPDFLAQIQAGLAGKSEPTGWVYEGSHVVGAVTVYRYWIRFDGAPHDWSVGLTSAGKIAGSGLK